MFDLQGRMYAKVVSINEGSFVEADGDFTCLAQGEVSKVHQDNEGHLFIPCSEGRHYLNGQLQENYYIGLYPA
jgi:hypothetical protein